MKFVSSLPNSEKIVMLKLRVNSGESIIEATDGITTVDLLGLRSEDGTVVRYVGQKDKLEKLGFATDSKGVIKLFN